MGSVWCHGASRDKRRENESRQWKTKQHPNPDRKDGKITVERCGDKTSFKPNDKGLNIFFLVNFTAPNNQIKLYTEFVYDHRYCLSFYTLANWRYLLYIAMIDSYFGLALKKSLKKKIRNSFPIYKIVYQMNSN